MANSMFNICRQFSISLGIAVSSLLISFNLKSYPSSLMHYMSYAHALVIFKLGFIAVSVVAIIGVLFAWSLKQ